MYKNIDKSPRYGYNYRHKRGKSMTVFEALNESKKNNLTEREILINLQKDCVLKLSEALEVCKLEFAENVSKFKEAAFDLKIESLPSSGYIKDGVTVVTDEWDD